MTKGKGSVCETDKLKEKRQIRSVAENEEEESEKKEIEKESEEKFIRGGQEVDVNSPFQCSLSFSYSFFIYFLNSKFSEILIFFVILFFLQFI